MIPEFAVWLILLVPLGSFAVIGLVIRPFFNRYASVAGLLTILAIGTSVALSAWALQSVITWDAPPDWQPVEWLTVNGLKISMGILLDPLTAVMLIVVTGVSLMVQIYSVGYMKDDRGYARYFAVMSLFTASMIGLVIARNVVQLYVFWELVGLCSYLLIGFWYHRPAAAAAAKKAFIVTRLADFGFLLAILYLFFNADAFTAQGLNPLDITDLYAALAIGGILTSGVITWLAVGIFVGAAGKSAQFPFHTWLPDAMEGPSPVSALIHAATMVTAGVFLVARFFPLFEESVTAMNAVAVVGGFTAIFAASMALVTNDIKRVLAYSTISQLGYMMLALGTGAYGAAIFHLFTHAFFKSLLFLGAGSVGHASGGTFDMRYMGGLRKVMPVTYVTFLIGGLALAGIFPLAGFWSKDEILAHALGQTGFVSQFVFWLALISVFMTAFYMFRAIFMTFEGEFRGGAEADPAAPEGGAKPHLAESPLVMVGPLVILALASIVAGFLANPTVDIGIIPIHGLSDFLGEGLERLGVHYELPDFNLPLAIASSAIAVAGIVFAFAMYLTRETLARRGARILRPAQVLLSRKYYLDEAYEDVLTRRVFYRGTAGILDWTDKSIVDGVVRLVDRFSRNIGRAIAQVQTGQLQGYGAVISVGIVLIVGTYLIFLR